MAQNMGNRYAERIKVYLSFALLVTFVFVIVLLAEFIGSVTYAKRWCLDVSTEVLLLFSH